MIEALRVMTYFKISLPTRNWDIAIKNASTMEAFLLGFPSLTITGFG